MASFNRSVKTGLQVGTLYVSDVKINWRYLRDDRLKYGWPNGSSLFLFFGVHRDPTAPGLKGLAGDQMVLIDMARSGSVFAPLLDLSELDRGWHLDFERYLGTRVPGEHPESYYVWKINNVIR
jgi:hypothetical protein